MTVTRKKILPALHQSDKVSKPDLQKIGDQNYTDTILRYGNLAIKHAELKTNAKTVVDAINELYATKSTVIPNPPDTPTDNLYTVKIDGDTYRISGGSTVIPNPPIPTSGVLITEDGQIIITESGDGLLPEQSSPGPTPVLPKLYTIGIDGEVYEIAGGSYVLPIASAETLGGIKVGSGLVIDSQTGVLSTSGGGSYTAGDGIYFSDIITENFATAAPESEYPKLSYTECHLTHTLRRTISIECNPTTGEFFGSRYDPATNTITVICRDNVPEGTPIAITYVATGTGNIINAEVGNLSTDLKQDMTKYEIRDNHIWDKSSNIQWIREGTVTDQYGTHTVYKTDLATYGAVAGESICRIYVTGAQKIYVYVKQDYEGLDTNYAYVVIGDFDRELGYDGRWSNAAKIYKGETTPDYDAFGWNNTTFEGESHYFDVWYHKQENPNASQETAHKNARAYIYVVVTSEYSSGNGEIFNVYHDSGKPIANGKYSHAEGYGTWAGGNYAHAEGMETLAGGEFYAHAEGYSCRAIGRQSAHAEGYMTEASGLESSHSEGYTTVASGTNSHAEGYNTKATYNHAHSEGGSTLAGAKAAHAEGEATSATSYAAHSEGYRTKAFGGDGAHAEGSNTVAEGTTHAEGYSSKAKHSGAHAEGYYSEATNTAAHAEGNYTQATGYASHAEGNYSQATAQYSHAEGSNTVASNYYAHAEGNSTEASGGDGAHAEGNNTVASGSSAHAEGTHTQATGAGSHAGGGYSIASGQYSYAMGDNATASGDYSHAEGQSTVATGDRSHAEGRNTTASADSAHAEGNGTIASNSYTHAEGQNSVASNAAAHAEGYGSTASGYVSHAEGYQTQARATGTHTEGYQTQATQNYAHAEGAYNIASGYESHAEGAHTIAAGNFSHAEGRGLEDALNVAAGVGSHVEGFQSQAIGDASHAEGGGTRAIGQESHSEGAGTWAYGKWSHAEGAGNRVFANYSHVEGAGVEVIKEFSHAEGAGNKCIGGYNHIEGGGNVSTNHMSHTEGAGNTNDGPQAHAEGSGNGLSGEESHVEGAGNKIHAPKSHGEGGGNSLYGLGSHVEGKHNEVAGFAVHAEGGWNFVGTNTPITQFLQTASYNVGDIVGPNSVYVNFSDFTEQIVSQYLYRCITAPGQIQSGNGVEFITPVTWDSSTAYTSGTVILYRTNNGIPLYYYANKDISAGVVPPLSDSVGAGWQRIEGILSPFKTTTSSGYYLLNADRLGSNVVAKVADGTTVQAMWEPIPAPKYTHIEGYRNIALGDYQHVGGKFNATDANKSFIIGNGADGDHRSNALTLDWSGNLVISGDVTTGTTLATSSQTLASAINEVYDIIPEVSIDDTLSTGTKVGTITIDGVDTEILVPSAGSSVQVTQIQDTGTHIADIEVDGVTTELYAPNAGGAIIDDNDIALDKTWSSYKINEMFFELAQRVAAIERYLWGQPVLTEEGDNRVTEDGIQRILEENEQ